MGIQSSDGAKLRGAKVGEISREALRDVWWDRLDDDERDALDKLSGFDPDDGSNKSALTRFALAENYLDYALKHQLERQSVVPLTRLKETALRIDHSLNHFAIFGVAP